MIHNATIRQGETFYQVGELFATPTLSIAQMRAMALVGVLLDTDIVMPCAWLADDDRAQFAWTMPRATSATLEVGRTYEHNIDLVGDTDTYEAAHGVITVRKGRKP
jgi:hypothetical protein